MQKTALIVDDSRTARVVLQQMLEEHDLLVDNVGSAELALAYLSDNRPDIIFMDHEMPGMDGFEAVTAIKKNPATATIPIMMYTAQEGELYVGQARALGAVGVLPKQVEPVELSKVLESLRVIGEDAERREHYDEAKEDYVTGEYPGLEKFDQDLGVLIQELFDQQRAILRRDLRDSQERIAARVADEIRLPEPEDSTSKTPWHQVQLPGPLQLAAGVLTVVVLIFAWLYWQAENISGALQRQNAELRRTLNERHVGETEDSFQVQRTLADYQSSLESTKEVAWRAIEWGANQSSLYDFDELPLGDYRLSIIAELSNHLQGLGFRGTVRIESHVGDFCMSTMGADGYMLAAPDIPAGQCDQIGFAPDEAYDLGLRQSVGFANFINRADDPSGGRIRYNIVSLGNSSPLLEYPAATTGITASVWNGIAASNNRVEISLLSDQP